MRRLLGHLPSPAMCVALIALFVALGGVGYAKTVVHFISGSTIKRGSIRADRLTRGARATLKGNQGPQGPQGPKGETGTVDTLNFYTKPQSDGRYLAVGGTAANASLLGGQPPSVFAAASLFGSPPSPVAGTAASGACVLSEILLMPHVYTTDTVPADGRLLMISTNTSLFSLIGTTYGGNGSTNFAVPDLRGAEPKGRGPAGVNYVICTAGIFP